MGSPKHGRGKFRTPFCNSRNSFILLLFPLPDERKREMNPQIVMEVFFHQRSMVEANSRFHFVILGTISFFFFPLPDGRKGHQSTILRKLSIHRSMLEGNSTWLHPAILGTGFIPLFPLPDERRKGYQSTNSDQILDSSKHA